MTALKKIAWLALIVMSVTGCKKDKSFLTDFNNALIGGWSVQSNRIEYYSESGTKIYEAVLDANNAAVQITFMNGLRAKVLTKNGENLSTRYDAGRENDVLYLSLSDVTIFEANTWQVLTYSSTDMIWKVIYTDVQYINEESGETLKAPKAELTMQLKKQ